MNSNDEVLSQSEPVTQAAEATEIEATQAEETTFEEEVADQESGDQDIGDQDAGVQDELPVAAQEIAAEPVLEELAEEAEEPEPAVEPEAEEAASPTATAGDDLFEESTPSDEELFLAALDGAIPGGDDDENDFVYTPLKRGQITKGTIASITSTEVLVDVGLKSEGVISSRDL